jgi:hypothetical protein
MKLHGVEREGLRAHDVMAFLARNADRGHLKIKRANEYVTPTHNARTTKVYSVSSPV